MPASYTHYLVAREALKTLPKEVKTALQPHLTLYFFGAQGADFCFFYRFFNPKSKNLGSYLHRKGGYNAFCVLKTLSSHDAAIRAYALGYATHYAADVLFHPYVYSIAGSSPLRHSRLEGAFDVHFRKRTEKDGYAAFFRKKLSKEEENELFVVYSAIAVKTGFPALRKPDFLRAISLFNAYPPISSALFESATDRLLAVALNKEHRAWAYPEAPDLIRRDGCDELFFRAVLFSSQLFEEFLSSLRNNAPLSHALFGKNYLTGL